MNPQHSLKPITRRAISIFYISPAECMLAAVFSGSGSGSSTTATIDITPVERAAGPASLTATVISGGVRLQWSAVENAYSYVVYRSTSADGPFTLVAANVGALEYVNEGGSSLFFYKVTAIEPNFGETYPSPVVKAS